MSCGAVPLRTGAPSRPGNARPCRGRLHVEAGDEPGGSRVTVELHTGTPRGGQVDHGLREALNGLKNAVASGER
ncbi:hypothetical protein ABZ330_17540 [Streptomyces sp. NPDC006172]|uniref:hypothetical protein n=1 Tax=Streptomyces sp. NPDC006172 TaxID=3154470 RepID=UPI0033DD6F55